MRWRAAVISIALSALFVISYGHCNVAAAANPHVGTMYYDWEMSLPFVPWLIVPYLSIDLFFVSSMFVCRTPAELYTLARRLTLAVLFACACFLAYPLKLVFAPPPVSGIFGAMFNWFRGVDMPYNLLPSLHIALGTILIHTYSRHTRGLLRGVVWVWFILIGVSTVLTYQHQVIDVAGGLLLGGYCFYFFREESWRLPVRPNPTVGCLYGAAGCLLLAVPFWLGRWSSPIWWPAVSFLISGAAYLGVGPGIYRKADGRLPFSTWLALGPSLWLQQMSLLYYRRQCRPWDEVVPGLWIGRVLTAPEARDAVHQGVTAVLDLTGEFEEAVPFLKQVYRNIPLLDLTAPTLHQMTAMADFITTEMARGTVYVHCKIGYSRSAAAVGAYLLTAGVATDPDGAVCLLRSVRPSIVVRPEIVECLRQFAAV